MNLLEKIRVERGLTYGQLAELAGYKDGATAWKHCQKDKVPTDAAAAYALALGVPFQVLRPDLPLEVIHGDRPTPTPPDEARL